MKKNTITKSIAYAYPSSQVADDYGFCQSGCYFVELIRWNIEGSGQVSTPWVDNSGGFIDPLDPDLLAAFNEAEGIIDTVLHPPVESFKIAWHGERMAR